MDGVYRRSDMLGVWLNALSFSACGWKVASTNSVLGSIVTSILVL